MNLTWAVICSSHSIDKDTNNVSLFNVMEAIQIVLRAPAGQPVVQDAVLPLGVELVTLWGRSDPLLPEQGEIRFGTQRGDSEPRYLPPSHVDLAEFPRHRQIAVFQSFRIPGELVTEVHQLRFLVEKQVGDDWHHEGAVPLEVSVEIAEEQREEFDLLHEEADQAVLG